MLLLNRAFGGKKQVLLTKLQASTLSSSLELKAPLKKVPIASNIFF